MKKLFAILLVTILTSCGAALEPPKSNTDYKNIKGKPIKIGNLEIAQYDFPDEMNFEQAKKACNELGEGWSLPSRNSLNVLYKNARKIGGFWSSQDAWYLSSTNVDGISIQNFFNGKHDEGGSNYKYLVRAVCCNMNEPPKDNTDYKKIIGNTVKIGNLEIAQFDFPIYMNWLDARSACAALGDGWTLPTKDELTILYQNKDKVGDFSDNEYWSNSFDEEVIDRNAGTISGYPIYKDFYSGEKFRSQFGNEKRYVRAIRAAIRTPEPPKSNTDYKNIIGKPIKIGNFEIAQYDFPVSMNWEDAKIFCTNLGKGWRLPTKEELNILYQNKVAIVGFAEDDSYWSSTEFGVNYAWGQYFDDGVQVSSNKYVDAYVRAIRAF